MVNGGSRCVNAPPAKPITRIPLVVGLVVTGAYRTKRGDEEIITTVTGATATAVDFTTEFRSIRAGKPESKMRTRQMRRVDLDKSNRLNRVFQSGDPTLFPGSTSGQISASTLTELKTVGIAPVVIGWTDDDAWDFDLGPIGIIQSGRKYYRGSYMRVGSGPEVLAMVVNGVQVKLPVIHARGSFTVGKDSIEVESWFLDDAANPLALKGRTGKHFDGQTVRLDFPVAQPKVAILQQALASGSCRANLSGVYFDFGQATLLPASKPALAAVAQLLRGKPDWTLRIEGHTDNVGNAEANQALSQRRAAAVRDALSSDYQLAATRLAANGFGATRPVASNSTLEGRAANRRVELARTCP